MNKEEIKIELENNFVEVNIDDTRISYCNSLDKILIKAMYNLQQENKRLKEIIDKAIEYIYYNSTRRKIFADIFDEYKNGEPKFCGNIGDLLKILKGESNE